MVVRVSPLSPNYTKESSVAIKRAFLQLEQLEERLDPIVHSWSASLVGQAQSPNAAGSPATIQINQNFGGGAPVPVLNAAQTAQGVPFQLTPPHVPGRDIVASHLL